MFNIRQNNKKLSIILLIAAILIQLFFLSLLILKIVNQGIESVPSILSTAQCIQYLQIKYENLSTINSLINSFIFIGIIIGMMLILSSTFLVIKNCKQQWDTSHLNILLINYSCLCCQCLVSGILLGYQLSFRTQSSHCQLSIEGSIFSLIASSLCFMFCLLYLGFYFLIIKEINNRQKKNQHSQKLSQQEQQLVCQFQKKTKQINEGLLNRKQFKFEEMVQSNKQERQFNVNVKQIINQNKSNQYKSQNEVQNLIQNSFYHDNQQFQSLKSQAQQSEKTAKYVVQQINQLKQLGFEMEYGDSQNKVKLTKDYLQTWSEGKHKEENDLAQNIISFHINMDKNNKVPIDQQVIHYGQLQNQDQIILCYQQTKEQMQKRKYKKKQLKRKLFQLKMKQSNNQLCPLSNLIQEDYVNQQQNLQKRIFQNQNLIEDFTIGAQICLYKPKIDQTAKINEVKMQDMYAQTMIYYDEQYLQKKEYNQKLSKVAKESSKSKIFFKNNPVSFLIESIDSGDKLKSQKKNTKQRVKTLQQIRGKLAY